MNVEIIKPYGYCNGVNNSIAIALKAKNENSNSKIYILGELIHNKQTNNLLEKSGFSFFNGSILEILQQLKKLDTSDIIVLPAHGTSIEIINELANRKFHFYDAVCPIVKRINNFVSNTDNEIIYVGIKDHAEAIATLSCSDKIFLFDFNEQNFDFSKITIDNPYIISQSTIPSSLFMDVVKKIMKIKPNVVVKNFLCPSIELREKNIITDTCSKNCYLIIGNKNSNNANMLLILYKKTTNINNCFLVSTVSDLKKIKLETYKKIYLTSATSTSKEQVEEIYNYIKKL